MSSPNSESPPTPPVERLASPCVRNCCLDQQDICLGCGRALSEILEWGAASHSRREQICLAAAARLAAR